MILAYTLFLWLIIAAAAAAATNTSFVQPWQLYREMYTE